MRPILGNEGGSIDGLHHATPRQLVLLVALSNEAREWVDEHLPEDRMTWGPNGTVIEPRYVSDIVTAMIHDGLTGTAGRLL